MEEVKATLELSAVAERACAADPWRSWDRPLRDGSGYGARETLMTRQMPFEPLPCTRFTLLVDCGVGRHRSRESIK
jgi:hypothetical protein